MENTAGIYIHIPFCTKKCAYCDFVSFPKMDEFFLPYKNALIAEMNAVKKNNQKKIQSVFIGGGTPTVLPISYIEEIMAQVHGFDLMQDAEITIEANPKTLSFEVLKGIQRSGINRLSIGLQAWQDPLLEKLGRVHKLRDFLVNFEDARNLGFKNINIDLMFSLPGQDTEQWMETIENVAGLNPEHISLYSLIIEEGTDFFDLYEKGELYLPDEITDRKMYYNARDYLKTKGYSQYEISNFSKPDFHSSHNILYWERDNYYGFGLNAHSMIDNIRWSNRPEMSNYLLNSGKLSAIRNDFQVLTENEKIEEYMFLGLRMTKGINIQKFYQYFGINIDEKYKNIIEKNIQAGLLKQEANHIFLTEKGIDLSNGVMSDFLLE